MKLRKDPLAASKLAKTILKTNPGIDRVTSEKLDVVDKLSLKKCKMSDHQRKLFVNKFESRRRKRSSLYERLKPKLEPSSRAMIEKYKTGGPKTERPVPLTVLKTSSSQQDKPVAPNHDEYDHDIENGENCVTSLDETETQDLSRRSSLHSSILEVTRSGSPDVSEHTENPLR